MTDKNNPAGRLHEILRQAKSKGDETQIREVWAQVLGEDQKDDSVITRKVVEVYQLSEEVRQLIEMRDGVNTELYLSSFHQIKKAIFPLNLNANWKGQRQSLTEGVMTRLEFCSELLSSFYTEEAISDEDLEKVTSHIDELFRAVLQSSLDEGLRLTLLEEIERLRSALSMYKIKGAKGLKQALQSTIGMVVANHDELSKAASANGDVIERLGILLDKIDSFTSKALKLHRAINKPVRSILGYIAKSYGDQGENSDVETDESEA